MLNIKDFLLEKLNLIFLLIGAGLFLGGQFTPELKSCGSFLNKSDGFARRSYPEISYPEKNWRFDKVNVE